MTSYGVSGYDVRLKEALHSWKSGRQQLSDLRYKGIVRRGLHSWEITPEYCQSCCYDILWDGGTIPSHLVTARHIAIVHKVGRKDLLEAIMKLGTVTDTLALRSS